MKKKSLLFFLFGLGDSLQVVASLSFSEIFILIAAPCLLMTGEYRQMRKTGTNVLFLSAVAVLCGATINYFYFGSVQYYTIRRFAQVLVVICAIVVAHWMLRKDMTGYKWWLVGVAISMVVSTFVFQQAVEVAKSQGGDVKEIMQGPIFWIQRIVNFIYLPISGWYLKTPQLYAVGAPVAFAISCLITTISGRSAAIASLGVAALMLVAGKSVSSIKRVHRYFWLFLFGAFILLPFANAGYRYLALSGKLGELAERKYLGQTQGEKGLMRLLIGGRSEALVGIYACMHQPILGFGLCGRDPKGYHDEFIREFGTREDIEHIHVTEQWLARFGLKQADFGIPTHSFIGAFWVYFGIFGLIFWLYVLFVFFRYLKRDACAVPQWYGWIACLLPNTVWNIFFSPFSGRILVTMLAVACLLVRAVRLGRLNLPGEMVREIRY